MNFSVIHLGGEHNVTGSCHLLQTSGLNIMVDCGIAQGRDSQSAISEWPVHPSEIDYLFLTHAHIDHIGRVPELIQNGFSGEIICTHPTRALLFPMLNDALNFSGLDAGEKQALQRRLDDLSWGFEYQAEFDLKKGLRFKLGNAGHILGSCFIRFWSQKEGWSIIFSGDLGASQTPILPDPDMAEACDLLILESTYGDRLHADRTGRIRRLGDILLKALSDGGKVFIPAFALGRTQELIYEMDRLFADKEYKGAFSGGLHDCKVPVFVDSPLGLEITEIYARLSPFWDEEAQELKAQGDHPIDFAHLYAVRNYQDHLRLLHMPEPAVIIAGSGMCSGGRILDHLASGLEDPKNDILFAGYQAQGTPGREIIESAQSARGAVWLNGDRVSLLAAVHVLSGYSAHADQRDLVNWVESMPAKPGKIKLVHGERSARDALAAILKNKDYIIV